MLETMEKVRTFKKEMNGSGGGGENYDKLVHEEDAIITCESK
jgi:hypothetical protein